MFAFRKIVITAAFVTLVAVACSSTDIPNPSGEATPPPQAVLEVMNQLSQELNVSVDQIEVVEFEQVDWPDACLGIPQENQMCAQVVTPGFRVVLEVDGQQYEFRSNQDGTLVLQAPRD